MRTAVHGMPRIGEGRALKWALEGFWAGRVGAEELEAQAAAVRQRNWQLMTAAGIGFIPSNDFSLYDHVLDAAVAVGAVPERFRREGEVGGLEAYFAMARGGDLGWGPLAPLDLTKWYDTNYHHLVPEIGPTTALGADPAKAAAELTEAGALGIETVPVLVGPFTLLARCVASEPGLEPLALLERVTGVYAELLVELGRRGAQWVRLDEPALVEERSSEELEMLRRAYERLSGTGGRPRLWLSTYFGHVGSAMPWLRELPVEGVGLDLCRGPRNVALLAEIGGIGDKVLFAGVVDGRNVWANDLEASLSLLDALEGLGGEVVASTSCSLLHVPVSLAGEGSLDPEVRPWLAFAEEKVAELAVLGAAASSGRASVSDALEANRSALEARRRSTRTSEPAVREAVAAAPVEPRRAAGTAERLAAQRSRLALADLPTTTIGSFPQTPELRAARAAWRSGHRDDGDYRRVLRREVDRALALQEEVGLDVLVHGEPERDDMVRYFAARMTGFVLPEEGWVQSFGSRCVRPPVLVGDVSRPTAITLEWTDYARSRTSRPVKAMLTGPVTMLRWSFVRDDQTEAETATQLALAVRAELADLQAAGAAVVQVDEPALREGLPLRAAERAGYLEWATRAFRLVTSAAGAATQVHTHMCYAELGDIVGALDELEVDVVSLEAARSDMRLLGPLETSTYAGGVGPGVYDVHSPIVPEVAELEALLRRALEVLPAERLWVNPDCGLKTRGYGEVRAALTNMVTAAQRVRSDFGDERDLDGRSGGEASP